MSDSVTPAPGVSARRFYIMTIVKQLGDIVRGIVSSLGSLVDGLKGSVATIEGISYKIAQTNTSFAMQLKEFSTELKLLDNYYTKVYIKIKAMVEFGMDKNVIPNIKTLITKREYDAAIKEIKSFLDILAGRIKKILDELANHDQKVADSKELQQQIQELNKRYEISKEHLQSLAENQKTAECFKIGKSILLLSSVATGGVWLCGNSSVHEKFERACTYIANNPGMLPFMTDKGIQGFNAITKSLAATDSLKATIEEEAQNMSKRFYEFFEKITEFQIQIHTIVNNTEELKKCTEELQCQLKDDSEKTTTEWINIAFKLQEMYELFENLDKEVVQKKIYWETHEMESPV